MNVVKEQSKHTQNTKKSWTQEQMEFLERLILEVLEVNVNENTRKREYVYARFIYYKLLYETGKIRVSKIARSLNKNHATVLYGLKSFQYILMQDPDFAEDYKTIRRMFFKLVDKSASIGDLYKELHLVDLEVERLNAELKKAHEELKKLRATNIRPRNQQTKIYYSSEGISEHAF